MTDLDDIACVVCHEKLDLSIDQKFVVVLETMDEIVIASMCKHTYAKYAEWIDSRPANVVLYGFCLSRTCLRDLVDEIEISIHDNDLPPKKINDQDDALGKRKTQ